MDRRLGWMAGLTTVVTMTGLVAGVVQPAAGWVIVDGSPAQLVVRDAASLSVADRVLFDELDDIGYIVEVRDDNDPATATADTAVVVLSTSVELAALGDKYKTTPAPLVALGNNAWPEVGLTQGTNGLNYDTTDLVVLDTAHPVATGLPAQFAPATTTGTLQSVNEPFLPAGADPVAARAGELTRHVVYTVPAGGTLGDGSTAAAARVALGYTADTVKDLSGDGYQLLENAIFWADDTLAPTDPATTGPAGATALAAAAGGRLLVQGRWNLDVIRNPGTGGDKITPSALSGEPAGQLDFNTTVSATDPVAPAGAHSLNFLGWKDDANPQQAGIQIDPSKSSVRIPHRPEFVPGDTQRFIVEAYVRPDNPAGVQTANDSPNIVQKGLQPDPDGQWKMSMSGDLRPICTFRGDTDNDPLTVTAQRNVSAPVGEELDADSRYRIRCILEPQKATLLVHEVNELGDLVPVTSEFHDYNKQLVFTIDNTASIWIGKKPENTTVSDTFAGDIDNVKIKRQAL